MFNTIIWATDGSRNADCALPYVRFLAQLREVTVIVTHVVEKYASNRAAGMSVYADEDQVAAKLEKIDADLCDEGLDARLKLVNHAGPQPAHEITKIARDAEADLIVVGTRGHTAIGGLLLGSVATRLLHLAPCPVLAVPAVHDRTGDSRDRELTHASDAR